MAASQRQVARASEYVGSFVIEVAMIPINALLFAGGAWLLRDRVELSWGHLVVAVIITYLLTVPMTIEIKHLMHGDRPRPPYTPQSQVVSDVVGRSVAGGIGLGLMADPGPLGAVIGALAGLVGAVGLALLTQPWRYDAEEMERAAAALRRERNNED